LPKSTEAQVLGKQVLRSGTSIGAHYREANRAKSASDFIHKLETCSARTGRNRLLVGINY
jgi:four helix bundle protein